MKCLLRPLNLEETISYVNHRLTAAGATRTIFETDGLEALFYLTRGLPRRINRLCDLALLIEQSDISLPHAAAHLIDFRRDLAEAASRLQTRSDVQWIPVFNF